MVTIRGEDLGADDEMRVGLVGTTARADLATITTDGQGHFTLVIEVPLDAPAGVYAVEAAAASGYNLTAVLFVEGAPVVAGDGAPPGQDEGLTAAAPVPSGQVAAAPAPAAVATFRPIVVSSSGAGSSDLDLVPFVALAGAIGALGVLVWRTRRPPAAHA